MTPPDNNLRDDLDDILALTKALDLVVSPLISTPWMAAAVGTPSLVFRSNEMATWLQFSRATFRGRLISSFSSARRRSRGTASPVFAPMWRANWAVDGRPARRPPRPPHCLAAVRGLQHQRNPGQRQGAGDAAAQLCHRGRPGPDGRLFGRRPWFDRSPIATAWTPAAEAVAAARRHLGRPADDPGRIP